MVAAFEGEMKVSALINTRLVMAFGCLVRVPCLWGKLRTNLILT